MSESTPNLFTYLGKPVKDEYGHIIGTMASFLVTPGGRINGVFIEHGDGRITRYSSDQIKTENDEAVLFSPLKMEANNFCNQIPLLWRKTQAIKDLNEKKKIPEDMYSDLYSSFEGALNQLKTDAQTTSNSVDKYIARCNAQIRQLNSALIHLEIEREIGRIDKSSYQTAIEMIKDGLKWAHAEREDLEALKNQMSNMLLGETPALSPQQDEQATAEPSKTPSPPLPEPPVVVHVKSAN